MEDTLEYLGRTFLEQRNVEIPLAFATENTRRYARELVEDHYLSPSQKLSEYFKR